MEKSSVNKKISYQEAMNQINSILEKLNNEELDIDALSKEIKKATELITLCKQKLRTAQDEIDKLFEK